MAKIVGLPKLSPTMDEGTLVRWAKQEGESVDVDDLLAEVETDKATMEFRSFDRGVLLKQLAAEGAVLEPDAPVAIIGEKNEDFSSLLSSLDKKATKPAIPAAISNAPQAVEKPKPALNVAEPIKIEGSQGRVRASPLVRRLAREQGINLKSLHGSGPKGRIVKRDLEGASSGGFAFNFPESQLPRVEPLSSMRKTIARRLSESKREVPHFYLTIDVDSDALWEMRKQVNAELEERGEKISVNDLIIKGVSLALRKVPEANASFAGDSIHYHNRVDISVAVAIPDGLVTPVVRSADRKHVVEIAREVRELANKAKNKKLSLEEMQNGTFSVSNLGMFGIEEFSAVINPPEGAILAVGAVRKEASVREDKIVAARRMRMTLSCDHRVIDGAVGAQFLAELKKLLERPILLWAPTP